MMQFDPAKVISICNKNLYENDIRLAVLKTCDDVDHFRSVVNSLDLEIYCNAYSIYDRSILVVDQPTRVSLTATHKLKMLFFYRFIGTEDSNNELPIWISFQWVLHYMTA